MRRLVLLFCIFWMAARPAISATLTPEEYRARLQDSARRLEQLEKQTSRPLPAALRPLSGNHSIKRADGVTQSVDDSEWVSRGIEAKANASKAQVRQALASVRKRLDELDGWTRRAENSEYFPASEAQLRMGQLVATGAVRVEPTAWEKFFANSAKAFEDAMKRFEKWLNGLFPTPTGTPPKMPNIDPDVVRFIVYVVIVVVLGLIIYLVVNAIGNPFARGKQSEEVWHAAGDDAELLQLPPDELLDRARALAAAGNYREALRHTYVRLLILLDSRGVWRYDARRTNWEHVALLGSGKFAELAPPMGELTRRFDRVRYGGAACESRDWQGFESDSSALENSLPGAGPRP